MPRRSFRPRSIVPEANAPCGTSGALYRLQRAEGELEAGFREEGTLAGRSLLRSALSDVRARREALEYLPDEYVLSSVGALLK